MIKLTFDDNTRENIAEALQAELDAALRDGKAAIELSTDGGAQAVIAALRG